MGDVRLIGNIASDRDEYSHGIAVLAADNITLGDIYGENIRGDVLYTYGRTTSEAEHQRNLVTGVVSGRNIYRCIVAMAGGEAKIAGIVQDRSEEHTSELQSLMRISYAVFCLKKTKITRTHKLQTTIKS